MKTKLILSMTLLTLLPLIPVKSFAQRTPLAILFENDDVTEIPGGIHEPLFCEGNIICGSVEYTDFNFIVQTPSLIDAFFTVKVCQGESCVTAHNAHFIENPIPELSDLYPDGTPFAATMTDHDPIDCNETTGKFKPACEASGLNLDYRCEVIIRFDDNGNFVSFSRSLSGSYTISRED